MALSSLPLDGDVQVVVDWLEFKVIASEYFSFSVSELQRIFDTRRNTEDSDFEEKSSEEEDFYQSVMNEIAHRIKCLSTSYPFALSDSGGSLELKKKPNEGMYAYMLCLLLSHTKQGEVFNGEYLPDITNRVRDYFQACSTLALAAVVSGNAFSFGFPRPDNSGFLAKLQLIYRRFGEGGVVTKIPRGASRSPKDEQIDVIGWQDRPDGAAGKHYVLGQVASGNDWPGKSIKGGPIDRFHRTWFNAPGIASQHSAALFIPCCIRANRGETANDKLLVLTSEFGDIYHRHVLPRLVLKGFRLGHRLAGRVTIERTDDYPEIVDWVGKELLKFRRTAQVNV
ncbi:hypothetical protein [Burkholderia ubonensis]|uniref:hypothetical protein n=1 Tax=Burkholderia ubonensis TaxID=101571 RepID=UPI000AA2D0AF|nr:hypothetical protein [Burkholderia ubonensis]